MNTILSEALKTPANPGPQLAMLLPVLLHKLAGVVLLVEIQVVAVSPLAGRILAYEFLIFNWRLLS